MVLRIEHPLRVLICDADTAAADRLKTTLLRSYWNEWMEELHVVGSLRDATAVVESTSIHPINAIFIDPILGGLDRTSDFVFSIRRRFPEAVFVLYSDLLEHPPAEFFHGERKRYRHYYRQSKGAADPKFALEADHNLLLCMSDLWLHRSTAEHRGPGAEIARIIERFKRHFKPNDEKVGFLIMPFNEGRKYKRIRATIQEELSKHEIIGVRADERQFHADLLTNVQTYAHGCDFGIAVLDRIKKDQSNSNVHLEIGYLMALGKPICYLQDETIERGETDLVGRLVQRFDVDSPKALRKALRKWLADHSFSRPGETAGSESGTT